MRRRPEQLWLETKIYGKTYYLKSETLEIASCLAANFTGERRTLGELDPEGTIVWLTKVKVKAGRHALDLPRKAKQLALPLPASKTR